jgi:penicillin-binding protein 2
MNQYSTRQFIIGGIFILVLIIYIFRLFYIQIIDPTYKYSAENNSQRYVTLYPSRGLIFDRNNKLLVCNQAAYDLMVNPQELGQFDTTDLCNILQITKDVVIENIRKAREYSVYKSSPFLYQVSDSAYAILQEKLYKFPGFYVQPRTLRKYTSIMAAHLFGYVGEVDSSVIKKDPYYQMGDYIGMSGIEKSYEKELRGEKGVSIFLVDVHNRVKGSLQNGRYDKPAVFGKNLSCTIDAKLQEMGEQYIKNFRGSIVAIDPKTGEILVLANSPTYDPNILVGRKRSKNFALLKSDPTMPLFQRSIMSKNPPGSTFKLLNALIGLKTGVVSPESQFACYLGYTAGNVHVACHSHPSPLDMTGAVKNSCNAYFDNVFRRIIDNPAKPSKYEAYDEWRNIIRSFSIGKRLNTDLLNELGGYVPTHQYYDRIYRKSWSSLTIISLAIGQGEVGATPLQLANLTACVANRGYYYIPHTIKKIEGLDTIDRRFTTRQYADIDSSLFKPVVDGMYMAVNEGGTAWWGAVKGLDICGKTGTAENPHGEDHSIFIAFAPKDNPKIAISVYVENGGFGATYAVPIASLLIEKYLTDTITRPYLEEYLKNARIDYNITK